VTYQGLTDSTIILRRKLGKKKKKKKKTTKTKKKKKKKKNGKLFLVSGSQTTLTYFFGGDLKDGEKKAKEPLTVQKKIFFGNTPNSIQKLRPITGVFARLRALRRLPPCGLRPMRRWRHV
jgi:hypothetical protein